MNSQHGDTFNQNIAIGKQSTVEKRKRLKRLRQPSKLQVGNSEKLDALSDQVSRRRRKETMQACNVIHGGESENTEPTLDGMWHTLVNESTQTQLTRYVGKSKKVVSKVISPVVQEAVAIFEKSEENVTRSLKVLYSKGLLSKEKYKAVRLSLSMSSNPKKRGRLSYRVFEHATIPKILTYDKLTKYIASVNVGNIKDLSDLCQDDDDGDVINGAYRELDDFLPILAELYIELDQLMQNDSYLMKFGTDQYKFLVALGADGAPFGKHDEATAWLVSFINSGDRITSQNENFLLAGANCVEDHLCMKVYARKLVSDIKVIESKEYFVKGFKVTFSFEMLPADMKWLATYSGELPNSACYFSSFANVSSNDKHVVNGSLGPGSENTWQPWVYEERLKVVQAVDEMKEGLSKKKLSVATVRKKTLEFIKGQGSRQEFEPLIGPLVDKAYAEPLHNSNNAWQFLHLKLLEVAIAKSEIPTSCVNPSVLPIHSPIRKYLDVLKDDVKATRLRKKLLTWFKSGRAKKFDYRFTGRDSRLLAHNFMSLINALTSLDDSDQIKLKLATIAFCCLKLRDAVSIFSRVIVDKEVLIEMKSCCSQFFNAVSLLLLNVTPTVWTVGYAIPYHSDLLFQKYGIGLGINSMQGREAKHVCLQQYARHSSVSRRWHNVLKHDYISSVFLRKQDPFHFAYHKTRSSYIPKRISSSGFCYCGYEKDETVSKCVYCSSSMYKAVEVTASQGKISRAISKLFSF